jgi:hypothetical protein
MRKGQVWIETVLYTVIGLAIMGVILSIVKPSLDEKRDQLVLNQAVEILEGIDSQVQEVVHTGAGNARTVEVTLKKGKLAIDGMNNSVVFSMDSKYMLSELGKEVSLGTIKVSTKERAKKSYVVTMTLDYSNYELTFKGEDKEKELQSSSTPYKVSVTNNGVLNEKTNVDFLVA